MGRHVAVEKEGAPPEKDGFKESRGGLRKALGRGLPLAEIGVLALCVALRVLFLAGTLPATFWDSPSYLVYASEWVQNGQLPPVGPRAPGYPAFLIAASLGPPDLGRVVWAQIAAGVIAGCAFFGAAKRLTNTPAALAAVICLQLSVDLIFYEVTVYSESLTASLLCIFVYLAARAMGERSLVWPAAAGLTMAGLCLTRPAFQAVLAASILLLVLFRRRQAAVYFLAAFFPVMGFCLFNQSRDGVFRIAMGRGFSMLNYVGHPGIYGNLPPRLANVAGLYREVTAGLPPGAVVGWGDGVLEKISVAEAAAGRVWRDWDEMGISVATCAIRANMPEYLKIWRRVFREYRADYFVWFGLYRNETVPVRDDTAQISGLRLRIVLGLRELWKLAQPYLTAANLFVFPAVLLFGLFLPERRKAAMLGLVLWAGFLLYSLGNTLIEPAPGQARYRAPWQGVLLLNTALAAHLAWIGRQRALSAIAGLKARRPGPVLRGGRRHASRQRSRWAGGAGRAPSGAKRVRAGPAGNRGATG